MFENSETYKNIKTIEDLESAAIDVRDALSSASVKVALDATMEDRDFSKDEDYIKYTGGLAAASMIVNMIKCFKENNNQ